MCHYRKARDVKFFYELPSSWKMGSLLRRSRGCGGEVGTAITARKPRLGWGNGVEGPCQAASPPLAHPWTTRTEPGLLLRVAIPFAAEAPR